MSGGSMEYFYGRLKSFLEEFESDFQTTPLRRAAYIKLQQAAEMLHDIEWVDSGDYGEGDEDAAILTFLAPIEVEGQMEDADLLLLQKKINERRKRRDGG